MDNSTSIVLTTGRQAPQKCPTEKLSVIWKALSLSGVLQNLKSQEFLFHSGGDVQSIFIVISGHLLLLKSETVLDILESGQSMGAALLSPDQRQQIYPVSAQALGSCQVLQIPYQRVTELLKSNQDIQNYFMSQFRQRMDYLQSCRALQNRPVAHRIAYFLIQKEKLLCNSVITRKVIAKCVCTTTETVIRTLTEWHRNKIIVCEGREITLLDLNYLQKLCA
jgi:CRP-like cAMP-binding protein